MSIVIAGTGYVGLVTGACLCEVGHSVFCVDIDAGGSNGFPPARCRFTNRVWRRWCKRCRIEASELHDARWREAYQRSKEDRTLSAPVVMIAVGTPSRDDGSADINGVLQVAREIGSVIDEYTVVASKSTVPVGTGDRVAQAIAESGADRTFSMSSATRNS